MKHRSLFSGPEVDPLYTPVYRLARFTGDLPPEEQPLLAVQRAMGGDEEKGTYLWNRINGVDKNKNTPWKYRLTDEQLLQLITEAE